MALKKGDYFENLIKRIQECIHKDAVIKLDDKLIDKHTGRKRQIDITITLKDGPTQFLAIVEVRDRSRPVGVDYLEQVKSKKEAVNANLAIIVSNNGFCNTAIEKAKNYNIKLYTVEEAMKEDWSLSTKSISHLDTFPIKTKDVTIYLMHNTKNQIINLPILTVNRINKEPLLNIFFNKKGENVLSLSDVNLSFINHLNNNFFRSIEPIEIKTIFEAGLDEKLFYKDEKNVTRQLKRVLIKGKFWTEIKKIPISKKQYKDTITDNVEAEILCANIGDSKFEAIIENPNQLDKDRKVAITFSKNIIDKK